MVGASHFLDAIRDDPDDDAVRLVYADWLEDHGDADRAEFIRTQCELARGVADVERRDRLRRRERELLVAHELEWVGSLRTAVRRAVFVRGFVERVTVHASRLAQAAPLLPSAPVRHLTLLEVGTLAPVVDLPELQQITTLDFREGFRLTPARVRQLASSPHLGRLTHLILRQCDLDIRAIAALAGAPALAQRLRTLDLYGASVDGDPIRPLMDSPHLAGLTTLGLGAHDDLGDVGAAALSDPECRLTSLRRLHLSYCAIGDAGARALVAAPHLAGLEYLNMTGNPIGRSGRKALTARFGERVRF
jgi:uncharacterized protein (TIGR02996 family)